MRVRNMQPWCQKGTYGILWVPVCIKVCPFNKRSGSLQAPRNRVLEHCRNWRIKVFGTSHALHALRSKLSSTRAADLVLFFAWNKSLQLQPRKGQNLSKQVGSTHNRRSLSLEECTAWSTESNHLGIPW